jgi:hypothetical protein
MLACPMHPAGGCAFARHGSYARVTPPGVRVARWYCPEGHRTFSLLPDFLAARLPGLLAAIEDTITTTASAKSMEAAADQLRGGDVTLPSGLRWLRRRVQSVHAALDAVAPLAGRTPITVVARCATILIDLGQSHALLRLRRALSSQALHRLPAPLGFLSSRGSRRSRGRDQHNMGPDEEIRAHYGIPTDETGLSCHANQSIPVLLTPRPPP